MSSHWVKYKLLDSSDVCRRIGINDSLKCQGQTIIEGIACNLFTKGKGVVNPILVNAAQHVVGHALIFILLYYYLPASFFA